MRVRRTGAGRGRSPTWYVAADRPDEQAAIVAGLLEERAPDARWRYILAWGFNRKAGAQRAMEDLRPAVQRAIDVMLAGELQVHAKTILAKLLQEHAQLDTHWTELRVLTVELNAIAGELNDTRLLVVAEMIVQWMSQGAGMRDRLTDTVQAACMLCGIADAT